MGKLPKNTNESEELKELKSIKNLIILLLLKSGATSDEINKAVDMGAGNVRRLFPGVKKGLQLRQAIKDE